MTELDPHDASLFKIHEKSNFVVTSILVVIFMIRM
jgi:hypothetical protein